MLHYVPREPAKDSWVVLRDPEDKDPNLSFQGRDRRPRSRSWLHLDLYTADQQAEVRVNDASCGDPAPSGAPADRHVRSLMRGAAHWRRIVARRSEGEEFPRAKPKPLSPGTEGSNPALSSSPADDRDRHRGADRIIVEPV